ATGSVGSLAAPDRGWGSSSFRPKPASAASTVDLAGARDRPRSSRQRRDAPRGWAPDPPRTAPRLIPVRRAPTAAALALLASVLLGGALPAGAAPAHVQAASNEVATGTINSVVFASPNVSGNLIVAFVIWSNGGTASVTDTRGNAYTAATSRVSWG